MKIDKSNRRFTENILTTKLFIPTPRADLVSRPRLVSMLNQGLNQKLILVSAPAGFGKTTLLSEWISQNELPFCWLSLDQKDNDLEQFIAYLIAALKPIQIKIDNQVLNSPLPQQLEDPTSLLVPLINQIVAAGRNFCLVLDDYHQVQNHDIHETITYILDNLPIQMHLVITTRSDPPLRLAQLRARGDLCEIRTADLRFTIDEAVHFINQNMGIDLSLPDITTLTQKTEGWIAGLQLAAISLEKHPDKHSFVISFAGDDRFIMDYLLDEALHGQIPHIQTFMLETSILEQFNASLCDAVTKRKDSDLILAKLERDNLFLVPLDNQRVWYRYHHLFAELLHIRLQQVAPSTIPKLHSNASRWYVQKKLLNQAFTHAIKANDLHQVEDLIQTNMMAIFDTGESAYIEKQLRAFQVEIEQPNLWISIAHAWSSVYSGQIKIAEEILHEAEGSIATTDQNKHQMDKASGHIATIRAYLADFRGEAIKVKEYAQDALRKLPKDDHLTVSFTLLMLATAFNRTGEIKKAETAVLDALIASKNSPNSFIRIDTLCMLSKIQQLQGQLHQSAATLQEGLDIAGERKRVLEPHLLPIIGFANIRKSILLYEWNQLELAWDIVNQGLEMVEQWGEKDSYIAGLIQSAQISQALGDTHQAFRTIKTAKHISKDFNYWFDRIEAIEALLHAKNGGVDHATKFMHKHQKLFNLAPVFTQEDIYRYLVEILLILGEIGEASNIIKKLIPVVEKSDSTDTLIRTLLLQSWVLSDLGDEETAVQILSNALELAAPGGYARVFIDGGDSVAHLLYACAQRSLHSTYAAKLLDEFTKYTQLQPLKSASGTEPLVEPISPREIDVLERIAKGYSNQEIAQVLHLSLYTIKSHARNIYGKLGVKNRTEAVAKARLLGLLPKD